MEIFSIESRLVQSNMGINFPNIIKTILSEYPQKAIFGGSSLIHDLYFPQENWGERDYDIWCMHSVYRKLLDKLRRNDNFVRMEKVNQPIRIQDSKYYNSFKIKAINDIIFSIRPDEVIKIQLIDIGSELNFDKVATNIDLSFDSVFYDGNFIYYVGTDEGEIMRKEGYYREGGRRECDCPDCISSIPGKSVDRIKKYETRGFKILNLCPFCEEYNMTRINHCTKCLAKFLDISEDKVGRKYELAEEMNADKIAKLDEKMQEITHPVAFASGLLILILSKQLAKFNEIFNNHISFLETSDAENIFNLLIKLTEIGNLTAVQLFFPFLKLSQKELIKKVRTLFSISGKYNFINLAKFYGRISTRFYLDICEDAIVNYKYLSIYELFLEYLNIDLIVGEIDGIRKIENLSDNIICPLCKCRNPNLELDCKHIMCDYCLMSMMDKEKEIFKCPFC